MVHYIIAGRPEDTNFVLVERLADFLEANLPHVHVHKHIIEENEWEGFFQRTIEEYGWTEEIGIEEPLVWTSAGLLVGNHAAFALAVANKYSIDDEDVRAVEAEGRIVEENKLIAARDRAARVAVEDDKKKESEMESRKERVNGITSLQEHLLEAHSYLRTIKGASSPLKRVIAKLRVVMKLRKRLQKLVRSKDDLAGLSDHSSSDSDLSDEDYDSADSDNAEEKEAKIRKLLAEITLMVRTLPLPAFGSIESGLHDLTTRVAEWTAPPDAEDVAAACDAFQANLSRVGPVVQQYVAWGKTRLELIALLNGSTHASLKHSLRLNLKSLKSEPPIASPKSKKKGKVEKGPPVKPPAEICLEICASGAALLAAAEAIHNDFHAVDQSNVRLFKQLALLLPPGAT